MGPSDIEGGRAGEEHLPDDSGLVRTGVRNQRRVDVQ
jgi:hypothetical protein